MPIEVVVTMPGDELTDLFEANLQMMYPAHAIGISVGSQLEKDIPRVFQLTPPPNSLK